MVEQNVLLQQRFYRAKNDPHRSRVSVQGVFTTSELDVTRVLTLSLRIRVGPRPSAPGIVHLFHQVHDGIERVLSLVADHGPNGGQTRTGRASIFIRHDLSQVTGFKYSGDDSHRPLR